MFLFTTSISQCTRPTSFQHLRTINGELCGSYREACQRLQLLENDDHWDQTINYAVISSAH